MAIYECPSMYFESLFKHIWFVSDKKELSVFYQMRHDCWLAYIMNYVVQTSEIILHISSDVHVMRHDWTHVEIWRVET